MHRYVLCLTGIAILLSSCLTGPSALDKAATMIAETVTASPPTRTPLPTATPLPTDTPTPLPTSTPNIGATATAKSSEILVDLGPTIGDEIVYGNGHLIWSQTDPVTIEMTGPQQGRGVFDEIGENLQAGNFIFSSDVSWNASGIIICGLIFRSQENIERGRQYQFYYYRLSGLPAYFIDFYDGGIFKNSVTKARFSEKLDVSNGSTNQFLLVAQDEQFIIYLNGERQGRYFDYSEQRLKGTFAFLAWQESGKGSCKFENSWIWALN